MSVEEQKAPYSYHTFLFPFIWNDGKNTTDCDRNITMDMFLKMLPIGTHWIEDVLGHEGFFPRNNVPEYCWDYGVYQYFTDPARKLVFGQEDGSLIRSFFYRQPDQEQRQLNTYEITKDGKKYTLQLNGIRLQVFASGAALLAFELENHESEQRNLAAVNIINEYGRRICYPYLPCKTEEDGKKVSNEAKAYLTADRIEIKFDGEVIMIPDEDEKAEKRAFACEYYLQTAKDLHDHFDDERRKMTTTYVMRPIQDILDGGLNQITSNKDHIKNKWFIRPIIDDRMFVCCIVSDSAFAKECGIYDREGATCLQAELQSRSGRGEYRYLSSCDSVDDGSNTSCKLYQLLFVDGKCTSCQSHIMRRELLKRCVYDRFIDWGTIHGVSHHAIICVTGDPQYVTDTVINPFLTEYVELAKIALIQRATILSLSARATEIANQAGDAKWPEKCFEFQKDYVTARNQIFLFEVTAQEQGVELFQMLENELYVTENLKKLDVQLENLYELANLQDDRKSQENDRYLNLIISILAIIAFVTGVLEALFPFWLEGYHRNFWWWLSLVSAGSICVLIWAVHRYVNRKRKAKK